LRRPGIAQTRTELRDEIAQTRTELRDEIAQTRAELRGEIAQTRTELRGEIRESELRLATRTVEQTAATRDRYAMLTGQLELRDRVERCEHDIEELKQRVS